MRHLALFMATLASIHAPLPAQAGEADADHTLRPRDVFELEWVSDPQIAPDGTRIAYLRNSMDIMKDRSRSVIWVIDADGKNQQPLVTEGASSPRWSPSGDRLLYVSSDGPDAHSQLHVLWLDSGKTARLTDLTESPSGLSWSPDGRWIAFSMHVPDDDKPYAELPSKPEGAEWAEPPVMIDRFHYRRDGKGYLKPGHRHLFVVPAEGGTPRQLTSGHFHHAATPAWSADSKALLFSSNRNEGWEFEPRNSEIYEVAIASGQIRALTSRSGPDHEPVVSPDGKHVAYLGFDDKAQGYQVTRLYVMDRDGSNPRCLTGSFDRSVRSPRWSTKRGGLFVRHDSEGNGKLAHVSLDGKVEALASNVGGLSLGRPYASGQFSVSKTDALAFTYTRPEHPAELAVAADGSVRVLTKHNEDLFAHREVAQVEELWWKSSHDGRRIHGWIAKPPAFDPKKKYPLILEIHGGPFANYGDRFAAEIQLYAAAGYVVLYANPRGSTSYGGEFGNLIHHAYPGNDYEDLMSGVDAVLEKGFVDAERLFVTGGSGGGVLSAWIIGKTDRFKAAVVAKPVINWTSFLLTTDYYAYFVQTWFPGPPWEMHETYWRRSPLSLVGNVKTPTMLLTGELDHRTPITESEQLYQALKLCKVDTALVRIPGASHGIARRPSRLIAKVAYVLKWFEDHDPATDR